MSCVFSAERPFPHYTLEEGCQFSEVDYTPTTVDGQNWCPFHCPMTDKSGQPTDKAAWDEAQHQAFLDEIHQRREVALKINDRHSKKEGRTNEWNAKAVLDLSGVIFPKRVDFRQTEFPAVSFYSVNLIGDAWFNEATFNGEAWFNEATFDHFALFVKTKFGGEAHFSDAQFPEGVSFEDAQFRGEAYFSDAQFRGANFTAVQFREEAGFGDAQFFGEANFRKAIFGGDAYFEDAQFSEDAWFGESQFRKDVEFQGATFSGAARFAAAVYNETGSDIRGDCFATADFTEVIFGAEVSFEGRKFLKSASFKDSTFTKAPNFHNCVLAEGTTFPSRKYFHDVTSEDAASAYCSLKMRVKEERERGKFYALEQKARRHHPETPLLEKLISYLYESTADFGESLWRPLVCLLLVLELFAFLYASTMVVYFPQGYHGYEVASLHMAIEQVFRPFSGWEPRSGTTMQAIFLDNGLPFFLKLLSTIQSLANISFFGLFIFAVRRKFRLG